MSALRLDGLPNEVVESINVFLSLRELCGVRLVSRSMAYKATQYHFGSFLTSNRLELTRPALELMLGLTAENGIGCFVEELTLVGVVYSPAGLPHQLMEGADAVLGRGCEWAGELRDDSEPGTPTDLAPVRAVVDNLRGQRADYDQLHAAGNDAALLTRIFRNIAANTNRRGLRSLITEVMVCRQDATTTQPASQGRDWRCVWQKAAETFHTLIRALATNHLKLQKLNVFCNDFSGHCSLECTQLSRCDWRASGVAFTFASLDSFRMSVSDRILLETRPDAPSTGDPFKQLVERRDAEEFELLSNFEPLKAQVAADENFSGLVMLLNSCKQLRELDLRRCFVRRRLHQELNGLEGGKYFHHLAEAVRLPNLQILALYNFTVTRQELLDFLKLHRVCELTLSKISLRLGDAWAEIFAYCQRNVSALHLENLLQNHQPMFFGECYEEIEDRVLEGLHKFQHEYRRERSQLKTLAWHIPRRRRFRPNSFINRRRERERNMFGPPESPFPRH